MTNTPIIRSLLENDLYKFTMWQALLHSHPAADAEYRFVCRNTPRFPLVELLAALCEELDHLCSLTFAQSELDYLRSLRFIKGDFVDFLSCSGFNAASSTCTSRATSWWSSPRVRSCT